MIDRRDFLARVAGASIGLAGARDGAVSGSQLAPGAPAAAGGNDQVAGALAAARATDRRCPGMVAAIVHRDRLAGIAAEGVRKVGARERVVVTDRFHMGSNTKAMTATMIGVLIDAGRLRWDSTLGSVFPDQVEMMHLAYRTVTLDMLLEHRAGLPPNVRWAAADPAVAPTFQRRAMLSTDLWQPPRSRPGSKFEYSNLGYVLAGLMAEEVTATPWETLMQRHVFGPLGMTTVGYGPPGTSWTVNQPWGHRPSGPTLVPDRGDNPPVIGPAGTVSLTVGDWARFASFHLGDGTWAGKRLLSPETFKELHTPAPGNNYAGGWLIGGRSLRGNNPVWEHAGSNKFWYALIRLYPRQGFGVLTACNAGEPIGDAACKQVADLLQRLESTTRG